jgi:hypothetical protein
MLCSISASSATININKTGNFIITNDFNNIANTYAGLGANNKVYSIEKKKVPKSIKQYENYTFQVSKGKKIKYRGAIKNGADFKGVTIKSSYINFGDGTKKKSTGWISHTYTKTGWKKITVTFNATFKEYNFWGVTASGKICDATAIYWVYIANKAQPDLRSISKYSSNAKDFKKGNVNFITIKVTNFGSVTSKATKIKVWYQDPKKFGKVYNKLKKYTATAKLKALKPGKSTAVRIYFKIPKKYSKLVKNISLDYLKKVNVISRRDTVYSFV